MEEELFNQGTCKMVEAAFFDIFGVVVFIFLLYMGMKFSKYKLNHIKFGGYLLMVIGTVGLLVDLYNVMNKYIIHLVIKWEKDITEQFIEENFPHLHL